MNPTPPVPTPPAASATASAAGLLPAALAPWAAELSALSRGLAVGLGPLVLGVDALVGAEQPRTAERGEPDGYGGLRRRGRPEQLRPAEWLLAEEWPEEFVRRHLEGELLYTAPEFRLPPATGRVVALVDAGPRAAGPARLVQLAALIVLHRRAAARGSALAVRVLGAPAEEELSGELSELLPRWRKARSLVEPDGAAVARARAALEAPDEAWLLTTPALAGRLSPAPPRTLTAEPAGWSPSGARSVRLTLGTSVSELPIPESGLAVRTLRGGEFRRRAEQVPQTVPGARLPVFTGLAPTLLGRGRGPEQLVAVRVRPDGNGQSGRPRTHGFGLPVLAAARIGRRLMALVDGSSELRLMLVGSPPAEPFPTSIDRAPFGLDPARLNALLSAPVLPLLWQDGTLALPLAGRWWSIAEDGAVRDDGPAGEGTDGGPAGFRWAREPRLYEGGSSAAADPGAPHRLYARDAVAWSHDGLEWQLAAPGRHVLRAIVPADSEAIGLVRQGDGLALVTCSTAGVLVRSVRTDGSRTLSQLSGGTVPPSVHPALPLVAAEPRPGQVVVGDAFTGLVRMTLGSST
ncbi:MULTISPECIES: hypothetical protein [Kitasatospora]|uniref:Uncharacterized protein n=1 Tax=Kitasatospora setae (strain ATCC 33774 / DSM 43861 / JCM 3304 / KCC A-0304 / NBRC 14216 / KM-6054) TaxID=452652 RepID=E4NIT3_KITSK|nr:hypothetical protein [Kitasatospora setae]BAJ32881.1 hypothetical protein KSE_71250 [Kitasatospora setae KM-6054]